MIELAALATTMVTTFLAPLVKEGAEELAKKLRAQSTDAAADGMVGAAKKLWGRLRGKTEGTPDAATLERFEQAPDDNKGSMEDLVRRLLTNDPDFEREARELVEAKEGGTTRWQLMGDIVGVVDARGATFSGSGDVAGVVYHAGEASVPPKSSVGRPPAPGGDG